MVSKYQTFDGEIIDDGWYVAQYKEDREVVWVYEGDLYTGPWQGDGIFVMTKDDSKKHHNFRPIYT